MADGVKDIDRGWQDRMQRLADLGNAEIKIGWTSGTPKHPKGKTPIAKVAGVNYGFRRMSNLWDRHEAEIDKRIKVAHDKVSAGMDPAKALIEVGDYFAEKIVADVKRIGIKKRTGALLGEVKVVGKIKGGKRGRPRSFKGNPVE